MALLRLTLMFTTVLSLELPVPNKYCTMERVQRMLAYNCYDLRLKDVPQYMRSGVEIMDLSENRIRDLTIASFQKYQDLKYLYMHDNMIQTIELGALDQLPLEVLDLSSNALTTIPLELFHKNTLRALYAADNNLFHFAQDIQENLHKPISAPLQIIQFSSCKLQSIPDLGVMPDLQHANFSQNQMSNLNVLQVANMCNLKTIDLNGTQIAGCTCWSLRSFLSSIKVYIKNGLHCNSDASDCSVSANSTNATEHIYTACLSITADRVQEERKSSILLYATIAAGSFLLLTILCCCCIRNRKIRRRRRKEKEMAATRRRERKQQLRLLQNQNQDRKESDRDSDHIQVEMAKIPPND